MSEHPLTWLDVFTDTPLAGNALAVVHAADGLDEATMLAFARETRLSETTFVQSGDAGCDYRNRIWMRTGELPMAGHPSLGTAVAVARLRGEHRVRYVQGTPAGLQPVDVVLDGVSARATMLQEPAEFLGEPDPTAVLTALGLDAEDAHPDLHCGLVSTGARQVLVPVSDAGALARSRPDATLVAELLREHAALTIYLFAWEGARGDAVARAFFLSSGDTVEEDAATGSAAGTLMAYLQRHAGLGSLTISQGASIGRPGRLECSVDGDRVRVGGRVVVLAEGVVHL